MSRAVAPSNTDDLQSWLQDTVKQLAFTRLIAAVVALVTRLRDLNTELTKQLANLRRARPRSERLRALEQDDIIEKRAAARRAEYELTDKGKALLPIIEEMRRFGHSWLVADESHTHAHGGKSVVPAA